MRLKRFLGSVCLLALLVAEQAHAEAGPAASYDPAAAQILFKQGRDALDRNDYEGACEKFAESYRLEPAPGTVMNWATCEEKLGRLASAWQHWQEAILRLSPKDDRKVYAQRQAEALEERLPYLTLRLAKDIPPNTQVTRDGIRLGTASLSQALPVDPGPHHIVVRAPGHAPREFKVQLEEREQKELEVSAGARLMAPAKAVTEDAEGTSSTATLGWMIGGVGGVGIGAAVVSGLMLPDKQRVVDDNCDNGLCNQAGLDAASEGNTLLIVNTTGWIVGIAGLGIGTYLVLTGTRSTETKAQRDVSLVPLERGIGLNYAGAF